MWCERLCPSVRVLLTYQYHYMNKCAYLRNSVKVSWRRKNWIALLWVLWPGCVVEMMLILGQLPFVQFFVGKNTHWKQPIRGQSLALYSGHNRPWFIILSDDGSRTSFRRFVCVSGKKQHKQRGRRKISKNINQFNAVPYFLALNTHFPFSMLHCHSEMATLIVGSYV
jgi:hypothetical protein